MGTIHNIITSLKASEEIFIKHDANKHLIIIQLMRVVDKKINTSSYHIDTELPYMTLNDVFFTDLIKLLQGKIDEQIKKEGPK